jgi:penicillin-binding protein 1A
MTTAYAMLVNGGKRVTPSLIDQVQDRNGKAIFKHDRRPCGSCEASAWEGQEAPVIPDTREQVADPSSAYQIVSMLEGVVKRGTGRRISTLGKPLAGKTGTTNESRDTWFIGFSPDLAVGIFVGFDTPKSLGNRETGSTVAAPVFKDFMEGALANRPTVPFRIPSGIRLVRVNASNGKPAGARDRNYILEAYKSGNEPDATTQSAVIGDGLPDEPGNATGETPPAPSRGLY